MEKLQKNKTHTHTLTEGGGRPYIKVFPLTRLETNNPFTGTVVSWGSGVPIHMGRFRKTYMITPLTVN